jgi:hypothetical protein
MGGHEASAVVQNPALPGEKDLASFFQGSADDVPFLEEMHRYVS